MCNKIEKNLTADLRYAIEGDSLDSVVGAWGNYFLYVRELEFQEKEYDRELYEKNIQIFHEWKLNLGI